MSEGQDIAMDLIASASSVVAGEVPLGSEIGVDPVSPPSPLHLDLKEQSRLLLADMGCSTLETAPVSVPRIIFDHAAGSGASPSELLGALSLMAAYEGSSQHVLSRFRPILIDILARWLEDSQSSDLASMERRLAVLASLSNVEPRLWSLISAFIETSPFKTSPLSVIPDAELTSIPAERLHSLLLAYLRLITADPRIATRNAWSITPLHVLRTEHADKGVRLLAIRILSLQRGWNEQKRHSMELEWVGPVDKVDVQILYGWETVTQADGRAGVRPVLVDGWVLPLIEDKRIRNSRTTLEPTFSVEPTIAVEHLCKHVTVIADTLLLRSVALHSSASSVHVRTHPTDAALQRISPLVQLGLPILLTAPPSSGKTHILQYLSSELFPSAQPTNRILTIPLADTSIDVKSLIGTYVSSPTMPGTFEWMEGALAKAIRAGRWVIFEDVDRGSTEMLVTLAGIARSLKPGRPGRRARLTIPGREDVEAGDGFALFVTRTIRQGYSAPVFFGHHIFTEVQLEAPSDEDILSILSARFIRLPRSLLSTLVDIWHHLRPFDKLSGQVKARDIGVRDLEKWCARVERNLPSTASLVALEQSGSGVLANPVLQDEVFFEAIDIFVASLDSKGVSNQKRTQMTSVIAQGLKLDDERTLALAGRKPALEVSPGSRQLHIGRTVMDITATNRRESPSTSRPFALTRPSLILLERIAVALTLGEPTLLVGETGTGKTTAVQHIASIVKKPLTVLNLSMQTESSDLLGGFKPIDASIAARNLHARWQKLFCETFSMGKAQNGSYVEAASKALGSRKWGRCADLWASSARRAIDKLGKGEPESATPPLEQPLKRRKITKATKMAILWQALLVDITDFDLHHVKMNSKLVFSFVEGPLVKAMTAGEWILLDEVNLASQETLEAISTILEGPTASLVLTERGDVEPIVRHPQFRLFACMNPATDVGKKDLPPNLRTRFTELYVPPPDDDREALVSIVSQYLADAAAGDRSVILDVAELYTTVKQLSAAKEIVDGSNAAPHFSMRTLARALTFAVESAPLFGLRRGLWEGFLMAFTMSLDLNSARIAHEVGEKYILAPMKNARAVLAQIPSLPASMDPDDFVRFGPFWLQRGPLPPAAESRYIITPSVQAKLSDLSRVILTKRYPVLIQGPTSAGKTSAVEFLAQQTGHRFVRINNHEHTDIQEYLGTYVTDPQTGNLVFQEGLLVTAVRQGHWIVLDELNLAPTDVLEALNRLLDDNRELVIPETQEVIKPHPNFILFATQNPPGLYAGRKVLSRAFRNRFLEVHFDDVPKVELETILCQRCQIAPSYAKKIVQVFEELRHRRQASRVFESKGSFATLRDLFRWAERGAVGYQQLAEDGYMLLAERARQDEDKVVIKQVIEDIMKVTVDDNNMYSLFDAESTILSRFPTTTLPDTKMVWTKAMQRLFSLVAAALTHNEPVLLVGETGCGKTSVCEVLAAMFDQQLVGVNCHQNMETADLLGSQRPVRNRLERRANILNTINGITPISVTSTDDEITATLTELVKRSDVDQAVVKRCQAEFKQLSALFEWSDGPLVHAMTAGDLLLLDEVSLADDSVLERLNSVLEPGRTLVLAEKGGVDIDEATIVAHDRFHVVATMNPGGDFGKKELSPALRNRFTEIWVPALNDRGDLLQIIGQSWKSEELKGCGPCILDFFLWFGERLGDAAGLGLRDIIAWVNFTNIMFTKGLSEAQAYHHGGQMVLVDGLESLPQVAGMSSTSIAKVRSDCMKQLDHYAVNLPGGANVDEKPDLVAAVDADSFHIDKFAVPLGPVRSQETMFRFNAPTTALNTMRLLRGSQLPKAILLEGSPGVGKTSLVSALAAAAGHVLQRINLSDQTDLIDLFGSDLPVEGGAPGEFQWRDAAFLDAMQKGEWVLLDEMNLASQTVLEGLNAVLDHRGTVYIPELGKSFVRHPDFRVFAAQNPLQQGGGRKGLPKSFLNRFTKVYLQEHTPEDLMIICRDLHDLPAGMIERMIAFNEAMREQTMITRMIGREGSPWEFNLRDLFRWFNLLSLPNGLERTTHPVEYFRMVYRQRFRNEHDQQAVTEIFERIFELQVDNTRPAPFVTPTHLQIGHSLIDRRGDATIDVHLRPESLDVAQSVLKSIELGWLTILAGESGAGKRNLVRGLAQAAGRPLGEFAMHPGVDTSEMLGSFEQQDINRLLDAVTREVTSLLEQVSDTHPAIASRLSDVTAARARCNDATDLDAAPAFRVWCEELLAHLAQHADIAMARQALDHLVKAGPHAVGFAWVDGQLIHAIKNGGWYLISDANLCSSSVLDRLNSLCENDGVLVLSEKGSSTGTPEILRPHRDFRLFMTYDPRHGELSRAMRNRGVELHFPSVPASNDISHSVSLADDSILRSYASFHTGHTEATALPASLASMTANRVSLQSRAIVPYLDKVGSVADAEEADLGRFVSTLLSADSHLAQAIEHHANQACSVQRPPVGFASDGLVDITLNPNIKAHIRGALFALLQTLLRNQVRQNEVKSWLANPESAKSILAVSASTTRRGPSRNKVQAGSDVFPFTDLFRAKLLEELPKVFSTSSADIDFRERLDRICVYVQLIEEHAKSTSFDYSSTKLLAGWLEEDIKCLPFLSPVLAKLEGLVKTVQLTQGHGQSEIWALFRDLQCESSVQQEVKRLAALANNIVDPELRSSVLLALASMNTRAPSHEDILELETLITGTTLLETSTEVTGQWCNWSVLSTLELPVLLGTTPEALGVIANDRQADVSSLMAVQRVASGDRTPTILFQAMSTWMQRMWDHTKANSEDIDGPADLFRPVRLSSVLRFSVTEAAKMSDIPLQDDALNFSIKSLLWNTKHHENRRTDVLGLALNAIGLICLAFDIAFDPSENPSRIIAQLSTAASAADADPLRSHARSVLGRTVVPSLIAIGENADDLRNIAGLWLAASRFLLDLYVTNIPIDPGVRRSLLGEVLEVRLSLAQEELAAVVAGEVAIKGVSDSDRVDLIRDKVSSIASERSSLGPALERPSDATRLSYLFNEVHSFLAEAYSEARVSDLSKVLLAGHAQSLARERDFQLASGAFVARLRSNYSDLSDLVQPIITAILFGKFGLRTLARHVQLDTCRAVPAVSSAILFPLVAGVREIHRSSVESPLEKTDGISTQLLAATAHFHLLNTDQQRASHLSSLLGQLDIIYQSWSEIRLREQQEAQDAESLYRVRKTDIEVLSDQEEEEKEFAELFPQYEDAGAEDAVVIKSVDTEKKAVQQGFQTSQVASFHALVKEIFGTQAVTPSNLFKSMIDDTLHHSFDAAAYDEQLDVTSLAYQVSVLHRRQVDLKTSSVRQNFYLSPNEPEVRKAHSLIVRIMKRLALLIEEWPEQMVPQHIRDRCERILLLDMRSPVAQVLSAIEQLLIHTDDWEAYANKENSLRGFRDEMTNLIIEWRRLELASWMRLLDDQAAQYVAQDEEWTLRLYGALIHGAVSSKEIGKHVEETLPMISTFIKSSTFGLFSSRLELLSCFERMARELAREVPQLSSMATMLHNVIANARLFEPRVVDSMHTQRSVIDKAIKDFVKLASWKDVNVYALKASAVKSHRQLHRSIRKFRDVLRQPVSPVLGELMSIVPQEAPVPSDMGVSAVFQPTLVTEQSVTSRQRAGVPVPQVLQRPEETWIRYAKVHEHVRDSLAGQSANHLDTAAVDIIETAAEFAKATPSTLTDKNKKIVNNLASRKRKAFADLLKALRACGFSQAVRADQLSRQQSTVWLADRPVISTDGLPADFDQAAAKKVESYHHRLDVLMSALRASFNGHNDDIASSDLQRGIGFTESIYATALVERDRSIDHLQSLAKLSSIIARLQHCSQSPAIAGSETLLEALVDVESSTTQTHSILREIEEGIRQLRDLQGVPARPNELDVIHELRQELSLLEKALSLALASVTESGCLIFTTSELSLLNTFTLLRARTTEVLQAMSIDSPELRHLAVPCLKTIQLMRVYDAPEHIDQMTTDAWSKSDEVIQALLVIAQQVKPLALRELSEDDSPNVSVELKEQRAFSSSLHVNSVISRLIALVTQMGGTAASTAGPDCLARVVPFLEAYAETYAQAVSAHLRTVKAAYKLSYVVGRLMLDLAQKGFCKPSEQSDDTGDGGEGETVEGSGMGAGTGDKNVSSEIKEESQVEGLQGEEEEEEKEEKQDGEDEDNDDAFSMDEDFEGKMEDGKEKEDGGSGEESEEEEDHDEHVGDVDPLDPGAVDEKFWGDEKEEEKDDGGEELMDQKAQEEQGESEMAAKEKDNKETKDKKDEKQDEQQEDGEQAPEGKQNEGDQQEEGEEVEEDEMGEEGEEKGEEDKPAGQDQQEVAMPEGETLDLPEDLQLDDDGEEQGKGDEGLDDDMDMPVDGEEEDEDGGDDGQGSDIDMGNEEEGQDTEEAPPATGVGEEDTQEEAQEAQNVDLSASNDQAQESELGKGVTGGIEGESKEDQNDDKEAGEKDEMEVEAQGQDGPAPQTQQQSGPSSDQQRDDGPTDSTGAPLPSNDNSQPEASRSLGDIMKEIRRRRDEILSQQEKEVDQPTDDQQAQQEAPGQVEYINDDQAKEDDQQALGRAGDEERQKLENLNIVDEEEGQTEMQGMEDEEEVEANADDAGEKQQPETGHRTAAPVTEREREEKALTQSDIGGGPRGPDADDLMDADFENMEDGIESKDIKPDVEGDEPDLNMVDAAPGASQQVAAEDLWRQYASLTSDLSYALCEQLRLILEPTLATRLQGDFRTGKRLNMRKIIPYIASEYTKDKIWLRRTKPSRREYQVLLSLDDSRSMSESHSVDLAYQTLALVAQAMNKLEVGQVSIAKFGEAVDILHPFKEGGFTDADGAKVMSSFKFDQHKTDVASLVERTLGYLGEARSSTAMSSSAPDLWQLQIIISDGVCQDHAKLRRLLRRALEERIMIVFIIVDSLHQGQGNGQAKPAATPSVPAVPNARPSILSMQTVEYKNVGGAMQLEMQRYLDTFPFEFYVVLRDVEALPGVLADTLRQWMARVSQSQE
ncbi:hypothetical protein IAU60_001709 [Kwoniella sp. DSM 27419]